MKVFNYSILLVLTAFFAGCQKYVDIKTQGVLVPGEYQNYRTMLNYTYNFESGAGLGDYSSDDVQYVDGSQQQLDLFGNQYYAHVGNSYMWAADIFPEVSSSYIDANWASLYNTITVSNIVISEVPNISDSGVAAQNKLIAEARVHRADAYLSLVNTYGKPYNAATAATDLGVPLVLTQTTTQLLNRASVQATYNQIIADLKWAIPYLPASQTFNTLPSKPSAFGVLSRCYFYMNNYDSAAVFADSALLYRSTLNDLAPLTEISAATYPIRRSDPEILLSKVSAYYGVSGYTPTSMRLSDTLLNVLGTKDQRYNLFTVPASMISSSYEDAGGRYFYLDNFLYEARNVGPTVPEMMLIKAENYARKGDAASAMTWVNRLRIKRFKAADYTPESASDANDALVKVIQERQREFFCRILRWWDMRRLKSETRFQRTLTRRFGGVTYTLEPNSNRYVFPISAYNRTLNPEIEPNP
ncbi:RagB/SusD family nutrient uptake outer membrane protein [Filimonas effusa]|uniref:RagB/SusD family nutrient uptake outer membrane protein n=1 Tax=Filimonas effusa TaxID=2508721 RepID=A0A4Q1DDU8_9BACT|nr:RagB/SusD family nutrient uptake outer membrane protein [Filimonas effusa]RXK86853.1 RagB/SusD family nutrient uptake outer membrane protein [Filimonas effusa]